jgi:hypothetical protein
LLSLNRTKAIRFRSLNFTLNNKAGIVPVCTPLAKFLGFDLLKVVTEILLSALPGFEFPKKDQRASLFGNFNLGSLRKRGRQDL